MATPSALPFPPQSQYINNRPHHDPKSETFLTYNPSTGAPLAQVYTATPSDIDLAIKASLAAFPSWAATPPVERSRILLKAVQLLRERNDEIARIETLDTGKAWAETSTVDVATGADVLEYFAGLGMGMGEGKTVQLRKKAWVYTKKVPLGVCVGIGAWNYPIQIALWKCAPALAAGNTFIFKPSEVTPLSATLLAQILTTAGLPPGVFQLLHGASNVGSALISDPRISKVSFTGQPSTGIAVYRTASQNLLPVTLELGGKSPFIVFPDADIDRAVDCCMTANFYSSGQVCTNGTRVFVHETICAEFTHRLKAKVEETVRIGDPLKPETNFGPVVSRQHYEKVVSYINHGIREDKATLVIGGPEKPESLPEELKSGFYVKPTIFAGCTDDMKIAREEIFGPVACIMSFSSKEEVIRRANDTVLGLAAGVFTRDLDTACEVMDEVNAGICWVNSWGESPAQMPVGGWGLSGLGFENGSEALAQFTKGKSVLVENGAVEPAFSKL